MNSESARNHSTAELNLKERGLGYIGSSICSFDLTHVVIFVPAVTAEMINQINLETNKANAIQKFGAEVVDQAEGFYETDFDKDFWRDLSDEDRQDYYLKAQR